MNDKHIKILLIEDNPGDVLLIREMLKSAGARFELEVAQRLSEGLTLLSENNYDLLLLDLGLPDSQRLETLKRAHAHAKEIPIVVLTGLADETVGIKAVQEGAQDYLIKGQVNESLLVRSIRYAIERKKAEEELRESEERFRQLSEASFEAIAIHDRGKILDVNEAFLNLFGYLREEVIGRSVLDFAAPESRELIMKNVLSDYLEPYEAVGLRKDGTRLTGELIGRTIPYRGGKARVTVIRDMTERKRAEEALQESEERFRNAFENANIGMCLVDLEMHLIRVNPQMAMMFGYTQKEMEGRSVNDFTHPEDWGISPDFIHKAISGETKNDQFIKRYYHKQGQILWGQVSSSLVWDTAGNPLYFISHIQDITERKQAEEKLRQSHLALEFINDLMSHDLTNINQAALGYLELLGETRFDETQGKYFANALYSVRRNAKLIDNVKRIMQEKKVSLKPTDLNACINDAISEILLPPNKKARINYEQKPCQVYANELLKNVIINLIDNAIKFDPSPEVVIDISVSEEGDNYRLSVADHGHGIPNEYKKTIFARLEKLERGVRGTGLGLHLVKTIVEDYGGEVWVEDNKPKGAIFNVLLPKVKR